MSGSARSRRAGGISPAGGDPHAAVAAVAPGLRVRVHYHLRRRDFSVTSTATGLVIANVPDITLAGVRFRVQPAGLARIRVRQCRAVCAYATGTVVRAGTAPPLAGLRRVTFNPYRADTFTCDGEPVHEAAEVIFASRAGWVLPGALRIARGLRALTAGGPGTRSGPGGWPGVSRPRADLDLEHDGGCAQRVVICARCSSWWWRSANPVRGGTGRPPKRKRFTRTRWS